MKISIIASVGKNNEIGSKNGLLWHLSSDLKRFKEITTGHTIIMGRKTYESIGRALPNRENIVITRDKDFKAEGIIIASSLDEALKKVKESDEEVFIIGGGEIYKIALPFAEKLYLTFVDASLPADVFFPEIDFANWNKIKTESHPKDEKNDYDSVFEIYEKKK